MAVLAYRCKKYHTRYKNGQVILFKPGDPIVPTEFELVSFPDRFELYDPSLGRIAPVQAEEIEEENTELDDKITEAKMKLMELINNENTDPDIVKSAEKLYSKNPQKEETKQNYLIAIGNLLNEAGEVEDETEE